MTTSIIDTLVRGSEAFYATGSKKPKKMSIGDLVTQIAKEALKLEACEERTTDRLITLRDRLIEKKEAVKNQFFFIRIFKEFRYNRLLNQLSNTIRHLQELPSAPKPTPPVVAIKATTAVPAPPLEKPVSSKEDLTLYLRALGFESYLLPEDFNNLLKKLIDSKTVLNVDPTATSRTCKYLTKSNGFQLAQQTGRHLTTGKAYAASLYGEEKALIIFKIYKFGGRGAITRLHAFANWLLENRETVTESNFHSLVKKFHRVSRD
jgi:hypothetical protein